MTRPRLNHKTPAAAAVGLAAAHVPVAAAVALTVALATNGCGTAAPAPAPAPSSTSESSYGPQGSRPSGTVTARQETRFTPSTCGARNQRQGCETYISDTLEVTDKTGRVHVLKVTQAVERHCQLRATYPACAKGATS